MCPSVLFFYFNNNYECDRLSFFFMYVSLSAFTVIVNYENYILMCYFD